MSKTDNKIVVNEFKPENVFVGIISLGCDKNRVDTENMLFYLTQGGFKITQDMNEADVLIVNTCAFINSAREEAIDTIMDCKKYNPQKIVATGCLPQKYVGEIFDELIEVDAFLGTGSYHEICKVIKNLYLSDNRINAVEKKVINVSPEKRVVTTPYHTAYLKIAEGCSNHCTYCTIPSIRGKYTSFSFDGLVEEAKMLADGGVKEIVFVAQDITKYGEDLGKNRLVELIQTVSKINTIKRIRLLYAYPESVSEELINEIATNEKVCKYIDIPLQHISDKILKLMGRKINKRGIIDLIEKLRTKVPNIAIRSTFIVGFPQETQTEFNELIEFLNEQKLNNVGFFAYSLEEDTPASKLSGQVEEQEKEKRVAVAYATQEKVSLENNLKMVGKTVEVLYEGINFDREEEVFYGRTEGQSLDVDGIVVLHSDNPLEVGEFYKAKITKCDSFDFFAKVEKQMNN